jgi:uncharacterized protein (DUF1778 family)
MATATVSRFGKAERIEARVQPEQKSRIEYAASLRGTSVSEFIIQNADAAAMRTIQEFATWELNIADRDLFVNALLNPPEPNERMRAAVQRHKERSQE